MGRISPDKFDFQFELGNICPKAKMGANIYIFGTGGAFEYYRRIILNIARVDIVDSIYAFLDNNPQKRNVLFYGKPILDPNSVTPNMGVVLTAVHKNIDFEVERQMMDKGFMYGNDLIILPFFKLMHMWCYRNFMRLKNIYVGERCFIVGNGASCTVSDLERISNEVSFGMNGIWRIFEKTSWRPSYYSALDTNVISRINENFSAAFDESVILSVFDRCLSRADLGTVFPEAFYLGLFCGVNGRPIEYLSPPFSDSPDIFCNGGSSSYILMQVAAFMGFSKIYLLGFDHDFKLARKNSGEFVYGKSYEKPLIIDHFVSNYHEGHFMEQYMENGFYCLNIDLVDAAYRSAREYADIHGIEILNATRGGKLEIFDRVEFDSLF